MTSNHAELFNTFLEAGKAMEELPQVKAKLDEAESSYLSAIVTIDDQKKVIDDRNAEIARLKEDLARREAELASATFREAEASAKINNLRAILGAGEPVPVVATSNVGPSFSHEEWRAFNAGQPRAVASQSDSTTMSQDAVDGIGYALSSAAEGGSKPMEAWGDATNPLSGSESKVTTYGVVTEHGFISHDPIEDQSEVHPTSTVATDSTTTNYANGAGVLSINDAGSQQDLSDPKPYADSQDTTYGDGSQSEANPTQAAHSEARSASPVQSHLDTASSVETAADRHGWDVKTPPSYPDAYSY